MSEKVSGDLCFFCDQDDVWLPDKIKVMAEAFENSPYAGAVCCFSTITDESLVPWPVQPVVRESVLSEILQSPEKIFRAFLAERITAAGHNIALSRKIATEGMVLLENNGLLPFKKGTKVALFGVGTLEYIKGGGGSGKVDRWRR